MTGASRGFMGGPRRGLRGKATSRAPHGYVHPVVACAGIDRVRTASREKSRSRQDHQHQAGSTGLNDTARRGMGRGMQQSCGRPQDRHEACSRKTPGFRV